MNHEIEAALRHRDAHDCALITLPVMSYWNHKEKSAEEKAHIINRAQTLQAGINMDFEKKIRHAKKVIERALDAHSNWAVSYSGGRDSTILSHLMVYEMGIKVPHVMSNTRMEYPETIQQVNSWYGKLREEGVSCNTCFPEFRPNVLWKKIGVPVWSKEIAYKYRKFSKSKSDKVPSYVPDNLKSEFIRAKDAGIKITEKCCDYLKKKPMKKWDKENGVKGHFTGVRCSESRARRLAWIQRGALYHSVTHGMWISNPLAFWTEADVKTYLLTRKIEVIRANTADGGSGCVTCMFGCRSQALEGKKNALQDLKTRNPKMWKTALDDWGYREVLDFLGISYE